MFRCLDVMFFFSIWMFWVLKIHFYFYVKQNPDCFKISLRFLTEQQDATYAAYQLAASVIKTCARGDELNHLVCRFLTSCVYDRDAVGSELKEFYHEIIFQVFQYAPQMLLAVIPSLIEELLVYPPFLVKL